MADKVKIRINKGASAIHFEVPKSPYIVFLCNPTSTKKRVVAPLWHFTKINLALTSDQVFVLNLPGSKLGILAHQILHLHLIWLVNMWWKSIETPENVKPLYPISDHNRRVTHGEVISAYCKYHILPPPNNFPCSLVPPKDSLWSCLAFMGLEPALP